MAGQALNKFYYFILTRRYKVSVKGEETLATPGAHLLLQNHPSHIDPQICALIAASYGDFVPVMSERFLRLPVIGKVLKNRGTIPVSDLKFGNRDPEVLNKVISGVKAALEKDKKVIIAPSGNIALCGEEIIKNKQTAHVLVSDLPSNTRVIGVRIKGLWGSMWSAAKKGKKPDFGLTFLKGGGYLLANLIFLTPKRKVSIEFVDLTEEAIEKAKGDRKSFNTYLEEFYNEDGPEKPTFVRRLFFLPGSKG